MMKTIAYKPILANFTDVNGELDFTSHDFDLNDDGTITYYEKQVGCFTSDKPYMEEDGEHKDRKYVYAKCAIPRQYTEAANIIERKGGTDISAELGINKLSYDSKSKCLILEDVVLMGATLLGVDAVSGDPIAPGMEGAKVDIADFSVDKNSVINKTDLINEITQAVVAKLDDHIAKNFANDNQGKEECGLENFDEKIKDVETETVEDKTVEENTTEEETPEVVEMNAEESEQEVEETNEEDNSEQEVEEESTDDKVVNIEYSVNYNGEVKVFSSSLMEKLNALYELVNTTYGEADNTWYDVDAYDEDKLVIMHDYWNGRHYRQNYQVRNDVYSLKGDRVEVFTTYLTKDEQAQVESMKANYAVISEKLAKYEAEPEKIAILDSKEYTSIRESAEFAELREEKNHFDFSVDEVKSKLDSILLAYAKSGQLNFARTKQEEKTEAPKKDFYAFARIERNTSFLDGLLKK